jgi:hypothetical protein
MKKFLRTILSLIRVIFSRAVPIITFAVMFIIIATVVDRYAIQKAPATDFVNYYSFQVPNARTGEDVFFTVCRTHKENFHYDGDLQVLVYNSTDPSEKPTTVFSKDIGGTLRDGDCQNKVLLASDYSHKTGTYKMSFCITFNVKYGIEKTACKESNIYKIYAQPSDVQSQIEFYQKQIDDLQKQLSDSESAAVNKSSSLDTSDSSTGSNGATGSTTNNTSTDNSTTNNSTATPPPAPTTCTIDALGIIKLGCR